MIGLNHMLNPIANATSGQAESAAKSSRSNAAAAAAAVRHKPSHSNNVMHEHYSIEQHQQQHDNNIIRISAKTAPQIVSSVPKCRNTKSSRHPIETINGSGVAINHDYYNHQNGKLHSKRNLVKQHSSNEQMVLIVNDDNQGAPIIGRRLPNKSIGSSSSSAQRHMSAEYPAHLAAAEIHHPQNEPSINHIDYSSQPTSGQPVVGRRSNRLMMQQQQHKQKQKRVSQIYQYDEQPLDYGAYDSYQEQQPLSIVESQVVANQQQVIRQRPAKSKTRNSGQSKTAMKERHQVKSLSIMNIADPTLESYSMSYSMAPVAATPHSKMRPHNQQVIAGRRSGRQLANASKMAPISCHAGCPCGGQQPYVADDYEAHQYHQMPQTQENCPCCEEYEGGVAEYPPSHSMMMNRSASCHRITACCANVQPQPLVASAASKRPIANKHYNEPVDQAYISPVLSNTDYMHPQHLPAPISNNDLDHHHHRQPLGSQRQGRSSVSRHHQHHSSCQANNGPIMNQATSGRPSASYRSSSCHDSQRHSRQGPMLISGRNLLPVHPKPTINFNPTLANQSQQQQPEIGSSSSGSSSATRHRLRTSAPSYQSPDLSASATGSEPDAGVSQMYESLAAELKAKLGDPKMGPILLPPKDYDTMSRKQGKLTGIELRRSTNPQLVGPTANRLSLSSTGCSMINEGIEAISTEQKQRQKLSSNINTVESPVCSSSRSSGRSQDDCSLQRSRSNSSSGLGSISMGAGSPNSSPSSKSSSSEDMRQASTCLMNSNNSTTTTNNNNNNNHFTKITINSDKIKNNQHLNSSKQQISVNNLQHNNNNNNTNNKSNQVGRKNLSPDCCGASDSGHSESGPFEEQKFRTNSNSSDIYNNNDKNLDKANSKQQQQQQESANNKQHKSLNLSSGGVLWNGRVEVPLKVNSSKNGNTYLATKQIIY